MEKDLILITAFCDTKEKIQVLRNLVQSFSDHRKTFDLMIFSHTPVPTDIVENVNFAIYDKKNELLYDWDMRGTPWFDPNNERPILSVFTNIYNTHLAIWRMIILGNGLAKNLGYYKVHHLEYDCEINDFSEFYNNSKILENRDAVVYNKLVATVDPILFGTYQAYRTDKLPKELYYLDENKIKEDIRNSSDKSPEAMLFNLLNHGENTEIKNKNILDNNGNNFGLSHNKISSEGTAWCLPYYDRLTNMLGFIVWNMEQKNQDITLQIIYNDEKVFDFGVIQPHIWKLQDIDFYENAKKLVVILNNKIRNIFEFDKYREEFKNSSYREEHKRP